MVLAVSVLSPFSLFSQDIAGGGTTTTYTGAEFLSKAKDGKIRIVNNNLTVTTTIEIAKGKSYTIDLNGYVLQGNLADGGFIFAVKEGGELIIEDSRPTLGHAGHLDDEGKFIWGTAGQTMGVSGGIIYNLQKSGKSTRGISVEGKCIIRKAKIMGCHAEDIGAAVVVSSSGTFVMESGEIRYNYTASKATAGHSAGVIYGEPSHNNQGSIINISNTVISDNNTLGNGGAICGYNVSLTRCTIENNKTTQNGGAVYIRKTDDSKDDASLSINSCKFSNNEANNGGAVFAEAGVSTVITNGTDKTIFSRNKAINNGGGIYVRTLNIGGAAGKLVLFEKNSAVTGGGLVIYGETDIDYCEIKNNYASANGGGIFARATTNISNSLITSNWAMSSEPKDAEKQVNLGRGGGFYFQGIKEDLSDTTNPTFTLSNTKVTGNASMYYGGGGQVCTGATLILNTGSNIDNNQSILHGAGGVHVTATARLTLEDGSISNNRAYTVGGAIHSSYGCELNFNGGIIQGNFANQRGGGVHINTGGEMVLNGTSIIGNSVERGKDMLYSTITENDGIYTWSQPEPGTTSGYNLDKDGNVALSGYGGGVLIDSGTFTMNSGVISNNSAEIGGGGVALVMIRIGEEENSTDDESIKLKKILGDDRLYNYKVANFRLISGTIADNKTLGNSAETEETRLGFEIGNGAGVYIMENNLKSKLKNLTKAEWQNIYTTRKQELDKPDNPYVYDDAVDGWKYTKFQELYTGISQATVTGGSITENEATGNGGGLFLQQGLVNLDNLNMSHNTALGDGGGLHLNDGTLTIGSNEVNKIESNTANNGGGVCIANGTLSIGNCSIKQNEATNFGGGLYVANTNQVAIELLGGGVFESNEALAGGGMAVGGPITLSFQGSLQNNKAVNGGGIYLLPGTQTVSGSKLIFKGGFIRNNQVMSENIMKNETAYQKSVTEVFGIGGGIFMGDYTTLSFDIVGNDLGFYSNFASNGADDIFANGKGTNVELPDVSNMNMAECNVPVPDDALYWVEDYITGDTGYSYGTKKKTENAGVLRYRDALKNPDLGTFKLETTDFENAKTKYLCLSLGYKLIYATIQKEGLRAGETAIFKLYNMKDSSNPLFYASILLMGTDGNSPVSKKIALPEGYWRVEETGWSWSYTPKVSNLDCEVRETDENLFNFTNNSKEIDERMYNESIKVNTMGSSLNNNQ